MMGLTDRVEPWARRFLRPTANEIAEGEPAAAPARPAPIDDPDPMDPPARRTRRFARRVLHEQER
jgi:hypothetical protein